MVIRQVIKPALGAGLLGIGAWALTENVIQGPEAVINAKAFIVRAPGDGYMSIDPVPHGSLIKRGAPLGKLTIVPALTSNSYETFAVEQAKARITAIRTELGPLEDEIGTLSQRASIYRQAKIKEIESKLAEATTNMSVAQARERAATEIRGRQTKLFARGLAPQSSIEAADSSADAARQDFSGAQQLARRLKAELAAARTGTFVIDGFSDSSYSRQKADELTMRVIQLRSELRQQRWLVTSLTTKIGLPDSANAPQQQRPIPIAEGLASPPSHAPNTPDASIPVASPTSGRIWTVAADGQFLRAGDRLAKIVDCTHLFAIVSTSNQSYSALAEGTRAQFHQEDGPTWQGRVIWAGYPERNLAKDFNAALDPLTTGKIRSEVVVSLNPPSESGPGANRCPIGRPGHVAFETSNTLHERLQKWLVSAQHSSIAEFLARLISRLQHQVYTQRHVI